MKESPARLRSRHGPRASSGVVGAPAHKNINYAQVITREIALEGLDGITLDALVTRLEAAAPTTLALLQLSDSGTEAEDVVDEKIPISSVQGSSKTSMDPGVREKLMQLAWEVARGQPEVAVYVLKEPRQDLIIFNRFDHVDSELGIVVEPEQLPPEIYPFSLVEEPGLEGIKGSCATFKTRREKTAEAKQIDNVDNVMNKYGKDKLVLVASQTLRGKALLGYRYSPLLVQTLTAMQWAMLERIGRSRYLGEVTQGKRSMQFMDVDAKTLFYHRKALIREKLLRKQIHYQKIRGQNYQGSLFHLPQFFVERRSKAHTLIQTIVNHLAASELKMISYDEVRKILGVGASTIKKLTKHGDFQRVLNSDERVPYRLLYPDGPTESKKGKKRAKAKEASCEGAGDDEVEEEKVIRVVKLVNPDVDPAMLWQSSSVKGEDDEEEEEQEGKLQAGVLDQSRWVLNKTMMRQAYDLLVEMGPKGISQQELGMQMGLGKLEARSICRNLERRGLVSILMSDSGRQRTSCFVLKRFEHLNKMSEDIKREKEKLDSLIKQRVTVKKEKVVNDDPVIDPSKDGMVEVSLDDSGFAAKLNKVKSESSVTSRQLKRANTIIELVRMHKVIDDPTKLYKVIQENELREGYDTKMDKKSLLRLLVKLSEENQIKNIFMKLKLGTQTKTLHFVCEPGIDERHTVIQSALEQAKMKLNVLPKSPSVGRVGGAGDSSSVEQSLQQMRTTLAASDHSGKTVLTPRYIRKYGLQPKFVRMRELHTFLFYLTRAYDAKPVNKEAAKECIKMEIGSAFDEEFEQELKSMDLYKEEISWKMFVPPLPQHEGWDVGWCLMCDVLLRLPLSLFTKLVNITHEVPGLEQLLNHPVRRHFLLRHLSPDIRSSILAHRKYIFTVHEVATRLAYLGLMQFGPQKLKEKDQVFLYMNKKASLMDTRQCDPSYFIARKPEGIELETSNYEFDSLEDIETYWCLNFRYDLWRICVETPLGVSSAVSPEEQKELASLEKPEKKPNLQKALNPKTNHEAPVNDTGVTPGDCKGAAGLDSYLFAHLKRNWSWHNKQQKPLDGANVTYEKRSETVKGSKRRKKSQAQPKVAESVAFKARKLKPRETLRAIKKTVKEEPKKKPYYDDCDRAALRLMRKLRVDWTSQEDSFLLLCKVAGVYLCKNSRNQMVPYTSVRDLLHSSFPESLNKTSRACQRRLNYMMKNKTTVDNVALFLAEVQQDDNILHQFPVPSRMNKEDNETRLKTDFEPLMRILLQKYQNRVSQVDQLHLPNDLEELKKKFSIIHPLPSIKESSGFQDPTDIDKIRCSVLNALVTSSLCSTSDKSSWAFQLFKIYQQYPDNLLRDVMEKLKKDKMVSLKKKYNTNRVRRSNFLPLSSSPYQLSVTFSHKFLSRYQYDIYHQSWILVKQFLQGFVNSKGTEVVVNHEGGFAAAVVGLMARNRLAFTTEVPEQLVVLDPNLCMVDHQYVRILQRYKELLRNSGSMDAEDLKVMDSAGSSVNSPLDSKKRLTVSALFKSPQKKMSEEQSQVGAKRKRNLMTEEEPTRLKKRRRSDEDDLSDHIVFLESGSQDSFQSGVEQRSSHQVAKSASRIALYMMREEFKDRGGATSSIATAETAKNSTGGPDSGAESFASNVQHSHDFFVISSCRVEARLKPPADFINAQDEEIKLDASLTAPRSMLPGDVNAAKEILNHYGVALNGLSNPATEKLRKTNFPKGGISLETWFQDNTCSEDEKRWLEWLCRFVEAAKELGRSAIELKKAMADVGLEEERGEALLNRLIAGKVVLHTGVVGARFVATTKGFATPWLLRSFRMSRVRDREAAAAKLVHGPTVQAASLEGNKDEVSSSSGGVSQVHLQGRGSKRRESLKNEDDVLSCSSKIDWGKVEEVSFMARPWLRVDGTLNRRVLDRLLGAVLGAAMQCPGRSAHMLCEAFTPALQPMHCRELVDVLGRLGCVQVTAAEKLCETSRLFAPSPMITLRPPRLLDLPEVLLVEPTPDAIIRLGQFIGDKQYSVDFVCQCSCHPDKRITE